MYVCVCVKRRCDGVKPRDAQSGDEEGFERVKRLTLTPPRARHTYHPCRQQVAVVELNLVLGPLRGAPPRR